MAGSALTPELALRYLDELSTDIRASVLMESDGSLAAVSETGPERGERLRSLARRLFAAADAAAAEPPGQVEVSLPDGAVFGVRQAPWTIVVVTGPFALSALMFYDLRHVLSDLGAKAA